MLSWKLLPEICILSDRPCFSYCCPESSFQRSLFFLTFLASLIAVLKALSWDLCSFWSALLRLLLLSWKLFPEIFVLSDLPCLDSYCCPESSFQRSVFFLIFLASLIAVLKAPSRDLCSFWPSLLLLLLSWKLLPEICILSDLPCFSYCCPESSFQRDLCSFWPSLLLLLLSWKLLPEICILSDLPCFSYCCPESSFQRSVFFLIFLIVWRFCFVSDLFNISDFDFSDRSHPASQGCPTVALSHQHATGPSKRATSQQF